MAEQFLTQKIEELVGESLCFVNFPDSLLREGLAAGLHQPQLVIEILEDATPDQKLLVCVKQLKRQGLKVALDDHIPNPSWDEFLPLVDFIKLDLRQTSMADCARLIERCRCYPALRFIAEKVETLDEFAAAQAAGFDLFQGYYFQQPQVISRRILTTSEMMAFELMSTVNSNEVDFNKLTALFNRDLSLTYNLLRYVNSLHAGTRQQKVDNLRGALVYLGQKQLKRFTALVMTAYISENKGIELQRLSMVRAKWCELLAEKVCPALKEDAFMCGLFSLLDVLLELPMEEVVAHIPLTEPIRQALLERKGPLGFLMSLIKDHEQANWTRLQQRLDFIKLSETFSSQCYEEAIQWCRRLNDNH
ncbi:EAL and modified HD-GYP domain-containing signal transduction protein [Oceanisphaera litoralis]|uniref:EAL and HDOD domain-containing protein n=1 Tax=Oceanisphaera litoralis TaxID=225144 RepID=UPI001EF7A59B|nr:HDOD domain-containing protein [Oceanisphaera litoralis]MBM7455600.1 EAL and modified HD-GYP domain-containing signal transduction protein [Oceanisphaera litoralis]